MKGLKRYRAGIPLPRRFVRSKSHPLRADKKTSKQPSHRPFLLKKDLRINSQKVLLAKVATGCRGQRQGLRYLFGLKSSLLEAIRRSLIIAHFYSSGEELVNGICYKPLNLRRLEG